MDVRAWRPYQKHSFTYPLVECHSSRWEHYSQYNITIQIIISDAVESSQIVIISDAVEPSQIIIISDAVEPSQIIIISDAVEPSQIGQHRLQTVFQGMFISFRQLTDRIKGRIRSGGLICIFTIAFLLF